MTCPEPQRISLPPHPSQVPTAGYQPSPPPALRTDQPPTDTDRLHRHSGLSEPQHRHRKPPALNNNGNAAEPRAAPLRHPPGYRASIISIKSLCPPSARLQTPARGRNYRAVPAPGTGGWGRNDDTGDTLQPAGTCSSVPRAGSARNLAERRGGPRSPQLHPAVTSLPPSFSSRRGGAAAAPLSRSRPRCHLGGGGAGAGAARLHCR